KLVVAADLGRGMIVPFVAFVDTIPALVGITLVLEFLSLLGQPPRTAMVPRLVSRENLVSANSLMLGAAYGTVPLGAGFILVLAMLPAVSLGGLVPAGNESLTLAFFADGLTFIFSGLLVATLPRIQAVVVQENANETGFSAKRTRADFIDGIKFFFQERSVRRVIIGMTTALFGGGTVIVLGPDFTKTVLNADEEGFFAIIAMLGVGAALGLAVVSANQDRWTQRDLVFGIATITTGVGLAAAAMVTTVAGAAAWMTVMGFGAGSAYLMGLTHLHERVDDEMRGRVFATLFALMRIGLFVAMAAAVPLKSVVSDVNIWRLDDPTRVVLFLGGLTIVAAGLGVLWSLRSSLRLPTVSREAQEIIAAANKARRSRTATGSDEKKDES
ncbi:MAG: hypothetical protein U9N84_03915, partial [Actinomycetota bacterium]|nr:hypothetical protein [Actinomycetota bacterium]